MSRTTTTTAMAGATGAGAGIGQQSSSSSSSPSTSSPRMASSSSMAAGATAAAAASARAATSPPYISSSSASALVSDLRPTVPSPHALDALNRWLDELLVRVLDGAQSLDPEVIKTRGVGVAFASGAAAGIKTLALGREAVNEAELELKAWKDGILRRRRKQQQQQQQATGEGEPDLGGAGDPTVEAFAKYPRGMMPSGPLDAAAGGAGFPTQEAIEMLRWRVVSYCTLASDKPSSLPDTVRETTLRWSAAGGSRSESVLAPASLYLTALIEHVGEWTLAALASVVARDSSSNMGSVAEVQDVYVALCEDEALWGLFKGMKVKRVIEEQITGSQGGSNVNDSTGLASVNAGGSHPQAIEYTPAGGLRASPSTGEFPTSTKRGSGVPLGAATALGHGRSASGFARPVASTAAGGGHSRHVSAASGRASFAGSAPLTVDSGKANGSSSRRELSALITPSPTATSFQARQASGSLETPRSGRDRQDEFEALIKSGQTMKVSLTPSRLKGFDAAGRAAPSPPKNVVSRSSSVSSAVRGKAGTSPQSLRLQPKSASVAEPDDDEEEQLAIDANDTATNTKRKESLKDVLSSDPPWPGQEQSSLNDQRRPSQGRLANGASAQPRDETIRAPTGDMANFLLSTAPPGEVLRSNSQAPSLAPPVATASLHDSYPGRRGSDRSAGESIAEGSKTKTVTADLADFFANTAPPSHENGRAGPPGESAKTEKHSRFRSLFGSKKTKKDAHADEAPDPKSAPEIGLKGPSKSRNGDGAYGNSSASSAPHGTAEQASRASLTALRPVPRPTRQPPAPFAATDTAGNVASREPSAQNGELVPAEKALQSEENRDLGHAASGQPAADSADRDASVPVAPDVSEKAIKPPSSATAFDPASSASPNAISLADLSSFRNLFQHATSADECRMLLDVVLTQWGVDQRAHQEETPEARVTAWLLTGREGPNRPAQQDRHTQDALAMK